MLRFTHRMLISHFAIFRYNSLKCTLHFENNLLSIRTNVLIAVRTVHAYFLLATSLILQSFCTIMLPLVLTECLSQQKLTTAWLAQLVGHQSAVQEVKGTTPTPDQHSGS